MSTHLEDMPRRAAMNPQRLVQRPVEQGAVAAELLPQLLLLLGVGEVGGGGGASTRFSPKAGGSTRDEEASAPCLGPPATMWPSHLLTSTPAWGSGAGVGRLAHWSHLGGGTSSSGISTAVAWELPVRAGSCCTTTAASDRATAAAGSCCGATTAVSNCASAAAGAGRASVADVAGCAAAIGASGCAYATYHAPAAAGARRASATTCCGSVVDVAGRGSEASAASREPPLAVAAVLTAARVAVDG
jgi:hypothetical protein